MGEGVPNVAVTPYFELVVRPPPAPRLPPALCPCPRFVLLAGRPPFSEASLYDAEFVRLVRGSFAFPASFPAPAVALLRHLLAVRPRDRWSVSDVYRDHWVRFA